MCFTVANDRVVIKLKYGGNMAGTTAKKRTENLFMQVLIPANVVRIAFCLDLVSSQISNAKLRADKHDILSWDTFVCTNFISTVYMDQ